MTAPKAQGALDMNQCGQRIRPRPRGRGHSQQRRGGWYADAPVHDGSTGEDGQCPGCQGGGLCRIRLREVDELGGAHENDGERTRTRS
jgi:hypothetical protein